jgi:hypothetical protein
MGAPNGRESAEVFRGWFDVQLRFAEVLAARGGLPLRDAITLHTNLHRRLAYGNVARQAPAPEFRALCAELERLSEHAERVDAVVSAFAERPAPSARTGSARFGCFSCEPPDAEGSVRLHFANKEGDSDTSPLHGSKIARRREELSALVEYLAQRSPETRRIVGTSWLYNTEAYRRLFPSEYVGSRRALESPPLHGGSTWGQLIDFRGLIKPAARERFLTSLTRESFDPKRPWTAFALRPLRTTAPFDAFRREYAR